MSFESISIIVPVYNEVRNIEPFIQRVEKALDGLDWELIFVDDKSTDGTTDLAYRLSLQNSRIRYILRLNDRGLAKSSIQGMLSAKGRLLCIMDGDGQHDPAVIPRLVERLQSGPFDIVSAARRFDDNANIIGALSPIRARLSKVGNRLSSFVIGRQMQDPLTGFFLMRRDIFVDIAPDLGDPGFKLLLDILHSRKTLRHAELPFDFGIRESGESKLDSYVIWQFVTFLLSKMTGGVVPASFISFLLVGSIGVLVHFAMLYSAFFLAASFTIAQLFAALVAASSNFFLNNLLTFRDRRLKGWKQLGGYMKFLLVSSVGIVANVSAATITYERLVHVVLFATLAGIAIDTIWKFVVANRLIWR